MKGNKNNNNNKRVIDLENFIHKISICGMIAQIEYRHHHYKGASKLYCRLLQEPRNLSQREIVALQSTGGKRKRQIRDLVRLQHPNRLYY